MTFAAGLTNPTGIAAYEGSREAKRYLKSIDS
jgi:hypothetical protein